MRAVDAILHRRMPTIASSCEDAQHIGSIYINRNMIGAVVSCGSDYAHEDTER